MNYISPKQMAEQLSMSKSQVYHILATDPTLRHYRKGKKIYIPADEPERWLKAQTTNSTTQKCCGTIRIKI